MGNQESLGPPASNSKILNYQLTQEKIPQMYITLNINSQSNDLTPFLALQKHREHIYSHQHTFSPQFVRVIHDGLCNDSCSVIFKDQSYCDNLFDEIQNRRSINRYYSHQQIWYLLGILCNVGQHVHKKGPKCIIGNIHPKNILMNEEGQIKICTLNSLPYERDHFVEYCRNGILSAYVSPETLGFVFKAHRNQYIGFPEQCVDKQVSEAFCLGMTILSMCTLNTNLEDIYDTSFYFQFPQSKTQSSVLNREMSFSKLSQHQRIKSNIEQPHSYKSLLQQDLLKRQLLKVSQRYCEQLGEVIKRLLIADPEYRLTIISLYEAIIEPNYEKISNLQLDWFPSTGRREDSKEWTRGEVKQFDSSY